MNRLILYGVLAFIAVLALSHLLAPAPRTVLLSFDTELVDTPGMVAFVTQTLDSHHANATFFVLGSFAQANPDLTLELARKYDVACHTMTHPRMGALNDSARRFELEACRSLLKNLAGKDVTGFRAPYNLLDKKTARLLGETGYSYDASAFEHAGLFYPTPPVSEIPISAWGIIPMEDSPLVYTLKLGDVGFWLMRQDKDERVSLVFHPRFVSAHQAAFEKLVAYYAEKNATFTTHQHISEEKHQSP